MDVNKWSCQVRTEVTYGFGGSLLGSSLLAGVGLRSRSFLGGGSLGSLGGGGFGGLRGLGGGSSLLGGRCLLCGGSLGGLLGGSR